MRHAPLALCATVILLLAAVARADDAAGKPALYVLSVQIDTKVLARREIPNSREARLLAKLATERSGALYGAVQTRVRYGEDATRGNILKDFRWLEAAMREQDVAVVFIAGHGLFDARHLLYTYHPVGGEITGREFRRAFDRIHGRKALFLQTCQAGGVLQTANGEVPFRRTLVVCASDDDETATRLMGEVMVNGLARWAADTNGVVTTRTLANWIQRRVPEVTQGRQHVEVRADPGFRDFALAPAGELIDPKMTGRF